MYAYGPVPSRRLGKSIGVSPIPPKVCSYSCIYCQLGKTSKLQVKREQFFPKEDILRDIARVVNAESADVITFVGDGEPTLYLDLGWLIKKSKAEFGLPTAVITNGSLLYHRDVQEDLLAADIVIPTLDAANPDLFKKINRPHKAIDYFDMVDGLIDFRRQFQGQFWLEVMLMADVNDSDEQLKLISRVVQEMKPQKVFVMTPIRPPTEKWVKCPSQRRVKAAGRMLANVVVLDNRESGDFGIAEFADAAEATLNIAGRHPLRLEQARTIAEKFNEANVIEDLLQDGKIEVSRYSQIEYIRPCKNQLKNGTETK